MEILSVINPNEVDSKLNFIKITEYLKKQDCYMDFNMYSKEKSMYQFLKEHDQGLIKFLKEEKFPDGLMVNYKNGFYNCYIIEMKHNPNHKTTLIKLKKQLFYGYLHLKTILNIMDVPQDKIKYYFLVPYVVDESVKENEYRLRNMKKIKPGVPLVPDIDYSSWKNNKLTFKEKDFELTFDINKFKCMPANKFKGKELFKQDCCII